MKLSAVLLMISISSIWGSSEVGETSTSDQLNTLSSESITSTNEPFLNHSIPAVKGFGELVENVVYKDKDRLKVIKVNIKGILQRTEVETLWKNLEYILAHPEEVGFQVRLEPDLLQIEGIDFRAPSVPEVRAIYPLYDPLLSILKVSEVLRLTVDVRNNEVFSSLLQVLSVSGSLIELSLINIENAVFLPRLAEFFQRHRNISKLELILRPKEQLEYLSADRTIGKETLRHYYAYFLNIEPQSFEPLLDLKELILVNLKVLEIEKILQRLVSLKLLDITSPELDDKTVEEFQKISKQRGHGNGFSVKVGFALKRHEIRELGNEGYIGKDKKIHCDTKYAGKTWTPDQE